MVRTSSVLAVPGRPGDQAVAAHEQRDHDLLQHLLLAHDHAPHLRHDLRSTSRKRSIRFFKTSGSNCGVTRVDMFGSVPHCDSSSSIFCAGR